MGGVLGDFNLDGRVDTADYTVWRNKLGTGFIAADASGNGSVDQADYNIWKANLRRGRSDWGRRRGFSRFGSRTDIALDGFRNDDRGRLRLARAARCVTADRRTAYCYRRSVFDCAAATMPSARKVSGVCSIESDCFMPA